MAKEICISTTPHETRLAILEDDQLAEIYYERENEYTLAGSVYKGRVTRVLPGMQSSFVDVGLERDAFLYVTDFLEEQEDSEDYETAGTAPAPARRGGEETGGEERRGRRGRDGRKAEKADAGSAEPPAPRAEQPREAVVARAPQAPADAQGEGDEEETPQGTRRWRGRRGRRRGGVRAGVLSTVAGEGTTEPVTEGELPDTAAAPFALPERGAPGGMAAPRASDGEDQDYEHGAAEPDRAPRSINLHAAAAPPAAQRASSGGAAGLLPGETLSKYGGAPSAASAPATATLLRPQRPVNYVAPRLASEVEVGAGWDGGAVLPGETLSRYREGEKQATAGEHDPASFPHRDEPETRHPREEESVPAADPEFELEPEESSAMGREASPEENTASTEAAGPHAGEAAVATEQQEHAAEEEYEPREGDAAAQGAPPAHSELRFSQLFGGSHSVKDEAPEPVRADGENPEAARSTVEAGTESPAARPSEAAEPAWFPEPATIQPATIQPAPRAQRAEDGVDEQALSPAFGRRFADEPGADDGRVGFEPAADQEMAGAPSLGELVDQLHGFAPGPGMLEEEVIDEEEYDFDPIHAHSDEHDLEDLEEETLDGEAGIPEDESLTLRMQDAGLEEAPEGDAGAFAFEAIEDEEEDSPAPAAEGEPSRRERGEGRERGRGGRNGRRRGIGGGGGGRRQSAQTQDLPIISDLLKTGQEILVQIAKEPIAKKGARITSHIALPGRFLVFMPTVNHVGVSRKIESDGERQRLKRILISEKGDSSGGFIVRTAAEGASEDDLRADLRFLINLWTEIKQRADSAKAPALIYHDLNLVERILRDQVSSNFSTIWVDTEVEYERIVRFLNRFQPSLVRRVKLYSKETPLFEHFGITEEISKALKSKVWLKSGGSIVINQTEALVAIDINTGKYVGKTARLEDTIVKTNLDAIPEIVRQIRLRDLGGIIVIDFIDMDERKNRQRVLTALEEALKADRAPSKVLQFNDFGLVAITRKRVKQSLERTLGVPCGICAGTGMVKSPVTVCNEIYIELRKMQKHLDGKDVMLRVNPEVVKQLKSSNGRWINEYEEMVGKTIIIKSDPGLHPEEFDIH